MVFHPSWGYFAKRYHLEQISIEIQGKEPKPAQLIELVEEAKKHDIKIVFVAPQFSQKGAKTISKSINGNVATINPLSEKWDENLLKVATEIAKSYK
jgi:zinc transport system substrate-binding protein